MPGSEKRGLLDGVTRWFGRNHGSQDAEPALEPVEQDVAFIPQAPPDKTLVKVARGAEQSEKGILWAIGEAYPGLQVRLDARGIVLSGGVHSGCEVGVSHVEVGVDIFSQVPDVLGPALREMLRRTVETGIIQKNEACVELEGRKVWCSASLVPGDDCYFMFAFDITERKRREAEYKELEQRLRHVHRMEALGQLAGGLAHDFNNLLTVITGHAQILRSRLGSESEGLVNLDKIQGASDGAASLTRVLLDFSRTSLVHPEWVNLNKVLEHLQRYIDRLLRDDVELDLDLGEGLPDVWADRGSVEQVFVSLADNAADAMPMGGRFRITTSVVHLTLDERQEEETFAPGEYVLVTLRDTGAGVTPESDSAVADFSFSKKTVGRGVGLDSVYGTMELVNGLLRMRTMKDVGTIFSLYFPAFKAPVVSLEERPVRVPGTGLQGRETLLVCDDDEDVRGVIRETLVAAGYQVLLADSPAHALLLEDANEEVLHMLVTDLVMPQTTGVELAEALRERRPGLRVLFISGYPAEVIENHTALDEDDALLPKPFAPRDLLEQVRELLDRRDDHPRS